MTTTTIYKKVGRRYVPIGACENEAMYFPRGASLVWVRDSMTLTQYGIEPADAALLAAAERMRDAMTDAMRKADRLEPDGKLTGVRLKAWNAYKAIAGEESALRLKGTSMHDVVDAGIQVLLNNLRK